MPTKKPIRRKTKEFANVNPLAGIDAAGATSGEIAPISNDYIRRYVGPLGPPSPSSAVYLQTDRNYNNQVYQELAQYFLYDWIEQDPHVKAVMNTRKMAVSALDWKIVPKKMVTTIKGKRILVASDEAIERAEIIEEKIRAIPGFNQDTIQALDALGKGFSPLEVIWGVDDTGFVTAVDIKQRPQRRFQFDAETMQPKLRTQANPWYGDNLPPMKFIVHRHMSTHENPFGDPLDSTIYWYWFFKTTGIKLWATFLETAAAPIPIVTIPSGSNASLKSAALDFVSRIRSGSGGYILDTLQLQWAEAKSAGQTGQVYEQWERYLDDGITKCILGQVLTTEASGAGGGGSRALGAIHNDVRRDILEYDAKALGETWSSTLVAWMNYFNFNDDLAPSFEYQLNESKDKVAETTAIRNLDQSGFSISPDYIEQDLQIPLERDDNGMLVKKPTPPPPVFGGFPPKPVEPVDDLKTKGE